MSGTSNNTGQVLGGATAIAMASVASNSDIAVLPDTGVGLLFKLLPIISLTFGILVLTSFLLKIIVKKFI